jgi:integrase
MNSAVPRRRRGTRADRPHPLRVNPKNRKLKVKRQRLVHLDITALVRPLGRWAAGPLVCSMPSRTLDDRCATLVFAGLRVTEACELTWGDVDLAAGRITVGRRGCLVREVDILPVLRDELTTYKAARRSRDGHKALVFTTAAGTGRDQDNVAAKVLRPVTARAEELLDVAGETPLPAGITSHKLRHTFTSILFALGRDPVDVMQQLGHTDPKFTLRIYAHMMRRSDAERAALKALVEGAEWAPLGTKTETASTREAEIPYGRGGFRTCDLSRVKPTSDGRRSPSFAGKIDSEIAAARDADAGILRPSGVGFGQRIALWPKLLGRRGRGCSGRLVDWGCRPVRLDADTPTDPLEQLLLAVAGAGDAPRLLTVAEVAAVLHVEAGWVYDHAASLGAFRLGSGSRAPIRFEARTVAARVRALAEGASFDLQELQPDVKQRKARKKRVARSAGLLPVRPRLGEVRHGTSA